MGKEEYWRAIARRNMVLDEANNKTGKKQKWSLTQSARNTNTKHKIKTRLISDNIIGNQIDHIFIAKKNKKLFIQDVRSFQGADV